ncbi:MAG: sigma-70 family RNA polymerase sigma factor [Planctomycetes bacterium]|nr:sigma-70 family RNA polymerase sigma factor [Planctomycetota bacterium]
MSELTEILNQFEQGNRDHQRRFLELVYEELRALAQTKLASEDPGQTLQPTALVHEAWLRLTNGSQPQIWQTRAHFFAAAAESMRRILVDAARRKRTVKHGGEFTRIQFIEELIEARPERTPEDDLIALDLALTQLAGADSQAARLVELRYFGGLSNNDAADSLGISARTAGRLWGFARAWLHRELTRAPATPRSL